MSYEAIILTAAKAAKVSGSLLLAICMHETGLKNASVPFDHGSPTYGVCQIKLDTAKMIGFTGKAPDLMVPGINAKWAAIYLKYQLDRYNGNWCKTVAAYNAGKFTESTISPGYPRNLKYVRKVQQKLAIHLQPKLSCGR